jgi:Resolvase, N terminal domain
MHTRPLKISPPRLQTKGRRHESAIAYTRVSNPLQGKSGLGLEAQQAALARLAEAEGHWLVETYQKVETGKGSDPLDGRRQLAAALKAARKRKAPIIVAKLDRLSRDVHFISGLMPLCDLAASTNAIDLAVDVRVFLIKTPLRRGCGNVGGARLAVAYRCRPRSG